MRGFGITYLGGLGLNSYCNIGAGAGLWLGRLSMLIGTVRKLGRVMVNMGTVVADEVIAQNCSMSK